MKFLPDLTRRRRCSVHPAFSRAVEVSPLRARTKGLIAPENAISSLFSSHNNIFKIVAMPYSCSCGSIDETIEISGLIEPAFAIFIRFSSLFLTRRQISIAACFCMSMSSKSRAETRLEMGRRSYRRWWRIYRICRCCNR